MNGVPEAQSENIKFRDASQGDSRMNEQSHSSFFSARLLTSRNNEIPREVKK